MIISTESMMSVLNHQETYLDGNLEPFQLSAEEKIVYLNMIWHYNPETKQCNPSISTISQEINIERKRVMDAISRLECAKFIRCTKRSGSRNDYQPLVYVNINQSENGTGTSPEIGLDDINQSENGTGPVRKRDGYQSENGTASLRYKEETKEETKEERNTLSKKRPLDIIPIRPKVHAESDALCGFEDWYAIYPKKQARGDAERAWIALHPNPALIETMIAAVNVQMRWQQWTKDGGKYIPLPATWIRGKRWLDELKQEDFQPQNGRKQLAWG
jgi:hypothetical protein